MDERTWTRLASLSWVAYLVLLVIAFTLLPKPMPPNDAGVQTLSSYFLSHRTIIKSYIALGSVANLFLLLFVTHLASRLRGKSEASAIVSRLVLASGTTAVITGYAVGSAQYAATTPGTASISTLFMAFVGTEMYAFGLFIVATGMASLATGLLPRWFSWMSVLAGTAELVVAVLVTVGASIGVISLALVVTWLLVAGVVASRREWLEPSAAPRVRSANVTPASAH